MKKEGIVTKYNHNCLLCGRPLEATHHLIGGTSKRKQSDQDGLTIPCCNDCHNMGDLSRRIHGNPMAEAMSKIIGQLAWEKRAVAEGQTEEEAREAFRKRYGESYL